MSRLLVTAAALALFASPVFAQDPVAASATSVNGPVQVNTGESFQPLSSGQTLRPGDRVMAAGSGSANIRFADGCDLKVEPGTMVTIPAVSPCAGGVVTTQTVTPSTGGAVRYSGGVDWPAVLIIAGTVAVGSAILYNEDEQITISP